MKAVKCHLNITAKILSSLEMCNQIDESAPLLSLKRIHLNYGEYNKQCARVLIILANSV